MTNRPMRTGLALGLALAAAWILARRRLDAVEVRGRSMAPTLREGDRILVVRATPRVGDVVLARDPRDPRRELVKRVAAMGPTGMLLRGDDPAFSTDGRTFGAIPTRAAGWRAVVRYWPPDRVGPIRRREPMEPIDEGGEPACTFPDALIVGERA